MVAMARAAAFDGLAPTASETLEETMRNAVSAGMFFGKLKDLDLRRAAVVVLPYQVTAR